jgi:cation diffusion facilitator CzcD-associated flavoprotein CzcO
MADADPQIVAKQATEGAVEHFDVLIVGAGISGIGSAHHLQDQCPEKSFVVLEAKDTFGGTWETHKYPGIRSDSDLYTFGYRFKPWIDAPIATSDKILRYMGEVIEEAGIGDHIRFGHRITGCSWSSAENRWTVEATDKASGTVQCFSCNFLWMCQGYYDHDNPYLPEWPNMGEYKGLLVHAQKWDPQTETAGKRVVVIGSGASAATIVPALASQCAHVTMLQRTPTYFLAHPNENEFADALRAGGIDEPTIHRVVRTKINYDFELLTERCKTEPDAIREELFTVARTYLGEDYDMSPHFTPSYRPWQQRLAFLPDGDMFQAIARGEASVVTDHIERFTEKGILLKSGEELEADIVIAATGFNLSVMGEIPFAVDGAAVDWADTITYRGMMFTGVPNMAWVFGYFRNSWTLRVDLMGDFVCRLLQAMDKNGARRIDVKLRAEDHNMPILPWITDDNFNPGYIQRGLHKMPKSGDKPEWMHNQHYWVEKDEIPAIDLSGSEFAYS